MRLRTCCFYLYVAASMVAAGVIAAGARTNGRNMIHQHIEPLENSVLRMQQQPPFNDLRAISARVDAGDGCGTGVLVTRRLGNETRTYVWTAGHVVEGLQKVDGTFKEATIYQENRCRGKYQGKRTAKATVIAYSSPGEGDDLALLEVQQANFCPLSVSAKFSLGQAIWPVGTELVHVGCTLGIYDSVSRGIISQTDRNILETGRVFDQTSVMAYPGSSGGGVYLASNGECIGLLTRGAGPGLNFIVPTRRMLPWAKKMGIEWAINPKCPMPTHVVRDPTPLTDGAESSAWMTAALRDAIDAITAIANQIVRGTLPHGSVQN